MLLLSGDDGPCKMPFVLPHKELALPLVPILQTPDRRQPDRKGSQDLTISATFLLVRPTISAFDYVLASGIPDQGKILTQISAHGRPTRPIVASHVISTIRRRIR
jgi:hypothetical protein